MGRLLQEDHRNPLVQGRKKEASGEIYKKPAAVKATEQ